MWTRNGPELDDIVEAITEIYNLRVLAVGATTCGYESEGRGGACAAGGDGGLDDGGQDGDSHEVGGGLKNGRSEHIC